MGLERKENHSFAVNTMSDDMLWAAFRYSHGELSAEEAEAFEEQLATEQPAREALAEATRLSEIVQASLAQALASRRAATRRLTKTDHALWRRSISSAAVGAAVCLALLLGWNAIWSGGNHDGVVNNDPSPPERIPNPQLLARAFPSGMDAWPLHEHEVVDPEPAEEYVAETDLPPAGFANDWIAMAVVAAQGGPAPGGPAKENQ